MQTLLGSLGGKEERSVPDLDGRLRDWEDWLGSREGTCEVEVMEQILDLLVKAFKKLATTSEGQEDNVLCPLQYFGEDWASMGQLPPTPPPSSTSSRRTSLYHNASHNRRGVEIAGVKNLASRTTEPGTCGENRQCKEEREEELLEMVLADEVKTTIHTSSSDDDGNKLSSFEPDFPPLAASTPWASTNGLDLDLSSGIEDSSSSGSDWLLGNHE